jgi:hypothetical protein
MLREISRFRHDTVHANRRLFSDSDIDLYIWFNKEVPVRFHLTYNKRGCSRSLSWNTETGFERTRQARIEGVALAMGISHIIDPLFSQDNADLPASVLAHRFLQASAHMAPWLADFIYARLLEYPGRDAVHIDQGTALRSF